MASPGPYDVLITYAAVQGWENAGYIVESGRSRIRGTVRSSAGWYEYKTEKIGRFEISKAGEMTVRIRPERFADHSLMHFKTIELVPADVPRP
jgi:hypothetical protein